jgi:hypothetical protein
MNTVETQLPYLKKSSRSLSASGRALMTSVEL